MADNIPESRENRIRRIFQHMAFEIGFGAFFIGLGAQSSVIHSGQATHYGYSNPLDFAMLMDTALFFIGAAALTKGIKSLSRALMLIAGIEPEPGKRR